MASAFDLNQIIQLSAWLLALLELIMGLYVLTLNPRLNTNRYVSVFLFVLTLNSLAIGTMVNADSISQAQLATIVLAATTPLILPALLLASIVLLKASFFKSWLGWTQYIPWALGVFPVLLTLSDVFLGTRFWFVGLDPATYAGGYALLGMYTGGSIGVLVTLWDIVLFDLAVLVLYLYVIFIDKTSTPPVKRITWLLLLANLISTFPLVFLQKPGVSAPVTLFAGLMYASVCTYAIFQQMVSERRLQKGSLRFRLTLLVVIIALPLLTAMSIILAGQARSELEKDALRSLDAARTSAASTVYLWSQYNLEALENLAGNVDIASMDPARQKPLLKAMAASYPSTVLVSTTDLDGVNVARSDDRPLRDYRDATWFQRIRDGAPIAYQAVAGEAGGKPALVVATPIKNPEGKITGVAMSVTDLVAISQLVEQPGLGQGGIVYAVDADNILMANPESNELKDVSNTAPVKALREGTTGSMIFTENGESWRGSVGALPNGWGIVAAQPEAVLFSPVRDFQRLAMLVVGIGAILLLILAWATMRQGFRPIQALTETTSAIAAGDLTRSVPVETQDELGELAESFNVMTGRLRQLIGGLELAVADRTRDLERRAVQLRVASNVAREAAAIRDLEQLLRYVVHMISDQFGYYHAGIFLLSESGSEERAAGAAGEGAGFAELRAASSEGGQRMLARRHRLEVGRVGIVGYVAASGQPRIALDVGQDAVFFSNPDLPQTRSEMALPLKVHDRIIGVLDVQSAEPAAFTGDDLSVLQTLADQVALAIENVRLLSESKQALKDVEDLFGQRVKEDWRKYLAAQPQGYSMTQAGIKPLTAETTESVETFHEGIPLREEDGSPVYAQKPEIEVPIQLRGQRLGSLHFSRAKERGDWSVQEKELLQDTVSQIALSLENARLLEEIQNRAEQEELINQIVARTQGSLDLDAVIRTAVQEVGRLKNVARVQIRLNREGVKEK
jgi:GAF domain-containing protein/HAMP domain-containing protein